MALFSIVNEHDTVFFKYIDGQKYKIKRKYWVGAWFARSYRLDLVETLYTHLDLQNMSVC